MSRDLQAITSESSESFLVSPRKRSQQVFSTGTGSVLASYPTSASRAQLVTGCLHAIGRSVGVVTVSPLRKRAVESCNRGGRV